MMMRPLTSHTNSSTVHLLSTASNRYLQKHLSLLLNDTFLVHNAA